MSSKVKTHGMLRKIKFKVNKSLQTKAVESSLYKDYERVKQLNKGTEYVDVDRDIGKKFKQRFEKTQIHAFVSKYTLTPSPGVTER
jgi:hypothetical protein